MYRRETYRMRWTKFLIDLGVAGAQLAADAAANALVPGAGIAPQGVRSFGEASQEARAAGASVRQQVTYGRLLSKNMQFPHRVMVFVHAFVVDSPCPLLDKPVIYIYNYKI